MSNNTSGSQKTAREKLQECEQQLAVLQAVAWMEQEAEEKKREEEEQKCLKDLKRIEKSKKWVAAAEEIVSFGCVF
jgi:hypothetical protein